MKLWQKFAVAFTTAVLVYGGQVRMWTNHRNRFLEFWELRDGLTLIAGMLLLAVIFTGLRELCARHRILRMIADHLFFLVLGAGAVSTFLSYPDYKSELLYLAFAVLATWSWCRPHLRIPQRVATLALIFSPVALILGYQLLSFPEWRSVPEGPVTKPVRADAHPIFLFVFDEWSYERSTANGEYLPLFKNVRAFAEQSYVYHFAQSPGPRTDESIPRLIYQTQDELVIRPSQTYWKQGEKLTPTQQVPSLFTLAREQGYASTLRGFYLPYRKILGDQVDSCTSYIEHPKPDGFFGRFRMNLVRNLSFGHDPISRRLGAKQEPAVRKAYSENWEMINRRLRNETLGLIANCQPNSFSLIHYPLPHCPWIFTPDGTYAGPYRGQRMSHDPEGYRNHLAYLDLVIGQFLNAMKQAGKYENALVIITSDHSWRLDYTFDGKLKDSEDLRHVPLFIKLPGQTTSERVDAKFSLTSLRPVFEAVMKGQVDQARKAQSATKPQ